MSVVDRTLDSEFNAAQYCTSYQSSHSIIPIYIDDEDAPRNP